MTCYDELIAIRDKYGYSEFDRAIRSMMRQRIAKGDRERRKPLPRAKRINLYAKQDGRCKRCGHQFPLKQMTDDHITPLSKGGTNDLRNRRLICLKCNREKSDNDMVQDSKSTGDTILNQLPGEDSASSE